MRLDYLHIILIILAICAFFYAVIIRRRIHIAKAKAVKRAENRFKEEIRIYKDALEREKTLYENLKTSKTEPAKTVKTDIQTFSVDANTLLMEQKKLAQEKEEFSEKNKRLWDMSLLIQKEKEHISALKADIEQKHRSVTDSIRYARRIQLAVLASKEILKHNFADYFLFWRPKEIVSGDFYWMKLSGENLAFTVADCTGHGVPGAFMSLLGITFLNDICIDLDENTLPSEVLEKLRTCITGALSQDVNEKEPQDGMDMALCILNLRTKKLRFSGGNNPLYLVRKGELTEYKAVKNPIGYHPKPKSFETEEIEVESGDWLYMFSDGFADQFSGSTMRKVTYKRFKELLSSLSEFSGEEQSQKLDDFLTQWRGNFPQIDDVLIGGYRIK